MKAKTIISMSVLVLSASVNASPFNYDFAELQIIKPDSNVLDNGFGVNASYDVAGNYNITGSYQRTQGRNRVFERDADHYSIGVGYHGQLNSATDFTSRLYYLHDRTTTTVKVNNNFERKTSNTGVGAQVGLRRVLGKDTDGTFDIGVRHVDGVDDPYANIGVEYHMSGALSVGAKYRFDNHVNSSSAMVRYEF